jgi:hypothetical protein
MAIALFSTVTWRFVSGAPDLHAWIAGPKLVSVWPHTASIDLDANFTKSSTYPHACGPRWTGLEPGQRNLTIAGEPRYLLASGPAKVSQDRAGHSVLVLDVLVLQNREFHHTPKGEVLIGCVVERGRHCDLPPP